MLSNNLLIHLNWDLREKEKKKTLDNITPQLYHLLLESSIYSLLFRSYISLWTQDSALKEHSPFHSSQDPQALV